MKYSEARALGPQFISKPATPLRSRPRGKYLFHALPFVAPARAKSDTPCWHVAPTGGYFGGYATGEAMALLYLKCLRGEVSTMNQLAMITTSFQRRFDLEGGTAMDKDFNNQTSEFSSARGQAAGFYGALDKWLLKAVQLAGRELDLLSEYDLICSANDGLGFDEDAYLAALEAEEKSCSN